MEQDLVPIVIINKIDKPSARPEEVVDEVLNSSSNWVRMMTNWNSELFMLQRSTEHLRFQTIQLIKSTMAPIFDTIIDHIPAPVDKSDEPLQFQVSLLDYNDFVGRIGIGRVFRGTVKLGTKPFLNWMERLRTSVLQSSLVSLVWNVVKFKAKAGDLIAISGMEDIFVGETITPTDATSNPSHR